METFFAILTLTAIVVVFTNEFFQQRLGVSPMPTVPRVRREMLHQIPQGTIGGIVEFGAGWGGVSFAAARAFPHCKVVGVEYSLFPFLALYLRRALTPGLANLTFVRRDFFTFPLQGVSVVLCYLSIPLMARLREKFEAELPAGSTVISSTFPVAGWEPQKVSDIKGLWKTRIFVYQPKGGVGV